MKSPLQSSWIPLHELTAEEEEEKVCSAGGDHFQTTARSGQRNTGAHSFHNLCPPQTTPPHYTRPYTLPPPTPSQPHTHTPAKRLEANAATVTYTMGLLWSALTHTHTHGLNTYRTALYWHHCSYQNRGEKMTLILTQGRYRVCEETTRTGRCSR